MLMRARRGKRRYPALDHLPVALTGESGDVKSSPLPVFFFVSKSTDYEMPRGARHLMSHKKVGQIFKARIP